jgi:glycosyltransferase involved in cell wall biosynthesis
MRIIVTLPWGQRLGGAEMMLQTVLDGAGETPHRLELVFFEDGPWPSELHEAGFAVDVIPTGRVRHAHRAARAVLRLAALLRRRRPDLLVNWMPKAQIYGGAAAAMAGIADRNVWWQHGISTGHWTDRAATALPALAVGCSSRAAAAAQQRLRPRRRTFVVAPGVPPPAADRVAAPASPPASPEPVVGIVGRLQPWKGQDRLLRAQALLREDGVRCHLLIVGGDAHGLSPRYARELPELVRRLGLDGSVTMTGHVEDPGPFMRRMDVLVNASDPEPFGIVLIEGMSRGIPVLAVGSGGPAEIVLDGETGVLARSGEPQALAEALRPLLESSELRSRLGAAGRERYTALYTAEAMRERFFAALESLLPGADPSAGAA